MCRFYRMYNEHVLVCLYENILYVCDNIFWTLILIFISVPISEVSLKPVSLDGVKEGSPFTFYCFTNAGRPQAQITWHFDNQVIQGNSPSLIENGTMFVVNSSFTKSFNKDDQGKRMYCSAVNIEGDPGIMSNDIEINVFCKFICIAIRSSIYAFTEMIIQVYILMWVYYYHLQPKTLLFS